MMEQRKFSNVEAFSFGFSTVFNHILFFLKLAITYIISATIALAISSGIGFLLFYNKIKHAGQWISEKVELTSAKDLAESLQKMQAEMAVHKVPTFVERMVNILKKIISQLDIWMVGSWILVFLLITLFFTLLSLGMTKINLDLYDKGESRISVLFSQGRLFLRGYVAKILYFLICLGGFFLFVIPGIVFAIQFMFYEKVLVDQDTGILEAFKKSSALTYGSKWHLFGIGVLFFLLNHLLGFSLGMYIIIIPAELLAITYIYRKLQSK